MSGGISFFSHLHALNTKWQLDLGSYLAREAKARMAGGSGITELLTGSSCSLPGSLFHEDKRSLASSRVHSYYAHTLITAMPWGEGCSHTGGAGACRGGNATSFQ